MLFLPNSVVSHIFKVFFNLLSLYLGSISKFKNMVSLAVLFDIVIWHTGINVFKRVYLQSVVQRSVISASTCG